MSITQEQLDHYDATLERYLRGEVTLAEVAAADPLDGALRRMAERAYERHSKKGDPVKNWKFDIRSAIGGFIIGLLLMFIAGTLRPPA